jgi:hypothetical protein
MKVLLLATATLAITVAADAAETLPSVTKARNSAVGYALTMDQVTNSFAGKCGATDRESARLARAAWNERNGELVRSADRYLDFVKRLVTHEKGEEAARRFYEEQKTAFASRAQLTVIDSLMAGGEREVCGQVLEAISKGRMDVEATPAHFRALQEIRAEITGAGK